MSKGRHVHGGRELGQAAGGRDQAPTQKGMKTKKVVDGFDVYGLRARAVFIQGMYSCQECNQDVTGKKSRVSSIGKRFLGKQMKEGPNKVSFFKLL